MKFLHKKGFTLVETLVAIAVLLLVLIGPMTAAQKGIRNAYFANEQIIAVFLAQEAIEAVRIIRDEDGLGAYDLLENSLPGADTWSSIENIISRCDTDDCAYVKEDTQKYIDCDEGEANNCIVTISSLDGSYGHSGADDTQFTRKVRVVETVIDGGEVVGAKFNVTVTWNSGYLGTRSIVMQTWVYDIYKYYE